MKPDPHFLLRFMKNTSDLSDGKIKAFLIESNAIEDIRVEPTQAQIDAVRAFLRLPKLTVEDVDAIVKVFQPNAVLRLNGELVSVGGYWPPRGSMGIKYKLESIITEKHCPTEPWAAHCEYEKLHPFTDGNGRSGRLIWAYQMLRCKKNPFAMPFLQRFYYETLSHYRFGQD